jgi:hypothetical protein
MSYEKITTLQLVISENAMETDIRLILHMPSLQRACSTQESGHRGLIGVQHQKSRNDNRMCATFFSNGTSRKERPSEFHLF